MAQASSAESRARIPPGVSNELGQRQEGDALAVGHATANEHACLVAQLGDELVHEPGLADPGGPENGEQVAGALGDRTSKGLIEQHQLAVSADQRRVESACERGSA